jgi:transketolase
MNRTYSETLGDLAHADPRIVVLTAENRAHLRGIPDSLPERFIDVGIAEQTLVGMSAGLAARGRRPVAHGLAAFLTMRAFEFIRTDVGIPALPVTLVGYIPGVLSEANGPTHQALEDLALMGGIPHLNVFCPADREDLIAGIRQIVASGEPWYVRYNDRTPGLDHRPQIDMTRAEVLERGIDVTILCAGSLLAEAVEASSRLADGGRSVGLVNVRVLTPLDEETLLESASSSRLLVTVEDHFLTGGLYSRVAELLVRRGRRATVFPIGFASRWFAPALLADVLEAERLNGEHIARRVEERLRDLEQEDNNHAQ